LLAKFGFHAFGTDGGRAPDPDFLDEDQSSFDDQPFFEDRDDGDVALDARRRC
jgi:hypothetical protein